MKHNTRKSKLRKPGSKAKPRKAPRKAQLRTSSSGSPVNPPRVIVKFRDGVALRYDDHVDRQLLELDAAHWRRIKERFAGIAIRRMFRSVTPRRLQELVQRALRQSEGYRPPNFLTYFVVDLPADIDSNELLKTLLEWRIVEIAYFEAPAEDPVVTSQDPSLPSIDPKMIHQGYLDAAPNGIDAKYAWTLPGGDGAGQHFIDLEQGWTLDHEDLKAHGAQVRYGTIVDTSRPHGTCVLGVVCAVTNRVGCRGIAFGLSSVNVVSHSGNVETVADTIVAAVNEMDLGSVLLLEVQRQLLPTERYLADFDAIALATASGITVIEAAGNGSSNLDLVGDESGALVFAKGARDSGSILVGAADSALPHQRRASSNFGSRVNCFAWGENVTAPTSTKVPRYSQTAYTNYFDGTSSAAPIIAGAALVVQGIATAKAGIRLNAFQMRQLLANSSLGTPCPNPQAENIGVMPDLSKILQSQIFNTMLLTQAPAVAPHR